MTVVITPLMNDELLGCCKAKCWLCSRDWDPLKLEFTQKREDIYLGSRDVSFIRYFSVPNVQLRLFGNVGQATTDKLAADVVCQEKEKRNNQN